MSPTQILYPQLHDLLDRGAQLVEVLPQADYAELHLPGALSLPLKHSTVRPPADLIAEQRWWSTAGTDSET